MGKKKVGSVLVSMWSKLGFYASWLGAGVSGLITRVNLVLSHTRSWEKLGQMTCGSI